MISKRVCLICLFSLALSGCSGKNNPFKNFKPKFVQSSEMVSQALYAANNRGDVKGKVQIEQEVAQRRAALETEFKKMTPDERKDAIAAGLFTEGGQSTFGD